ncbi:hypothetical protein [Rhodococcus wratislaviensis]|uniref:hypothetical protein n=1 Tax=Rhodococcus wratislaviensis TaxID=44752 RepID=UPI0011C05C26|nr:hypothetical protein [Rhodococcus wratislaviensis]
MSQTIHSTDIVDIRKGTTQAKKAYKGSTVIWTPPAVLHSMKCIKNGSQLLVQSLLTVITPWTADGAYANTVMAPSNTGLKADGNGTWDITIQLTWTTVGSAGTNRRINLLKNGVQYGATFNPVNGNATQSATWTGVPIAINDVITAQSFHASTSSTNRQVMGGATTYILAVV